MSSIGMYFKEVADNLIGNRVKLPIVIPSYKRPQAPALKWISKIPSLYAYVFIREDEYEKYNLWNSFSNIHTVVIPNDTVSNIGETRAFMMNWCLKNNINKAFQLDDDVTGIDYLYEYKNPVNEKIYMRSAHLNESDENFKGANPVAFNVWEHQINEIEKELGYEIALCSIPLREFSWTIPKTPYRLDRDIPIQCIYINYALLNQANVHYKSNNTVGWEDLSLAVYARRAGLHMAHVYGLTYSTPPMGRTPGGCNGNEPEKTCWDRSKKFSETFMKNVSNNDPALYIKELPKQSLVVVRCHWDKLKTEEE